MKVRNIDSFFADVNIRPKLTFCRYLGKIVRFSCMIKSLSGPYSFNSPSQPIFVLGAFLQSQPLIGNLICLSHGVRSAPGIFNRFARENDLLIKKDSANRSNNRRNRGDYQSPKSPNRHLPLGGQISLAALCFVAGVYSVAHAFRRSVSVGIAPAISYLFAGTVGVGSGIAFSLSNYATG